MTAGGFERVIPMAVGIITFILIICTVLSLPSWQSTITDPGLDHSNEVPNPISILGSSYLVWDLVGGAPGAGVNVTPHCQNISNNYWVSSWSSWYGKNENNKSTFTDPEYPTHFIDVRIIRDNVWYREDETRIDPDFGAYKDYIAFDASHTDFNMLMPWETRLSLETIMNGQSEGKNYSTVPLGAWNISVMIITPGNFTAFETDLYGDTYTLYIVQEPQLSYTDFWSVLWWIMTFNTAWMPDMPLLAGIVSAVVFITIGLVALRIAQGFIP